jgi:hypothetical protein
MLIIMNSPHRSHPLSPPSNAFLVRAFAAFLLGLIAVSAQNEAKSQLQFVSFPRSAHLQPIQLRIGETEVLEVDLPTGHLSKVYHVKPMASWALGKIIENEEGKTVFDTYGQAKSLGSRKQLIVVMRKGKRDSDGLELIPVTNGTAGFGGGEYLFVNASRVKVGGYLGENKFTLPPGAMEIVRPKTSAEKGVRSVSFVKIFYRSGKEEFTPFFSSEWRYSKSARSLAFVYHNPGTDRLRLHVIRDYPPAP